MLTLAAFLNSLSDKAASVAGVFRLSGVASAVAQKLWRERKCIPTDAQGRALIVMVT